MIGPVMGFSGCMEVPPCTVCPFEFHTFTYGFGGHTLGNFWYRYLDRWHRPILYTLSNLL